ncbi:MAG: HAMP domain-containing histidine kinase, partial [Bacteroidia bacterium]|nr:HAMP domain-containing histidine kinase [Bacteroidia bacterium]
HVLTHEIMNSMTPISSLSSTLKEKAEKLDQRKEDPDTVYDLSEGLKIIEKRSLGLMSFVDNYKKINTLPVPEFRTVYLEELFNRLKMLKQEELLKKGILLKTDLKNPKLSLILDAGLIDQVLINLVNNAADSLAGCKNASIHLWAERSGNKTLVLVKDNGTGIAEENLNKIFIPFFSTKKTGSGIGLSFSKQVMRLHRGNLSVKSITGSETIFVLEFPAEN